MRHFLTLKDYSRKEILGLISLSEEIKKKPEKYASKLAGKRLLMIFAKPSLRTRLSFEAAMLELGGSSIFYELSNSVLGKKESIKDFSRVSSLYVHAMMARLFEHGEIEEIARYSAVPVINGLTNRYHPCQALGDLLTIKELFGNFKVKLAYLGDANNNVTHSLMIASSKTGIEMGVACPKRKEFMPDPRLVKETGINIVSPSEAVKDADIIYTDSWQSYHIKDKEMVKRRKYLRDFQVNPKNFNRKAYFMHCLPALRGEEVTADIIDGSRSVILQQAENRKHSEKALLVKLLG